MHAYAYIRLARLLTRRTAVIYEVQMAYMTCNVDSWRDFAWCTYGDATDSK